ncbi:hypothetical protein QE361_000956 [Sphingomonas sp. SORGH_AS802]|uniref:PEP-CTERM sorting domain-containing protein n=1 Tax=unclassified Sphingomonas TaxID=196159 RepID=UPI0028631570|nr:MULTISPECIES: PEP-CTERM sorting domain-containing protein [unclassified Sphingomonas]MDR6125363.1 hypothetical protein [Sphingomonas sp. SORGH_AS_0438]MDR6133981.1 hypothetical protein [Sphingomonas sp. SORGH_AS_0802]
MRNFLEAAVIACSTLLMSSASHAAIFNLTRVVGISESTFINGDSRTNLKAGEVVKIKPGDTIVETIYFRGGHIKGVNSQDFLVFGSISDSENLIKSDFKDLKFLDVNGKLFGEKRHMSYLDSVMIAAKGLDGSGAPEVYGLRYQIRFDSDASRARASIVDFSFRPRAVNAQYVPGDLFASAVPEPSSWAMMGLGFAGLGVALRDRRRRAVEAAAA